MTLSPLLEDGHLSVGLISCWASGGSYHHYTLAQPGKGRLPQVQLPPLILGKGSRSTSSSSRVTSISSSGPSIRDGLDEVLVVRGRGLSRNLLDEHPHPDTTEEVIPHYYLQSIHEAISSFNSTPASSGRSSPTTETHSALSASQGGWTTGNTTERSSLDSSGSWDEFDRQAANTVTQRLDEIDTLLFEGSVDSTSEIHKECQEWSSQFPHLRILGKQVIVPTETGFQGIPLEGSRPPSSSMLLDVTDNDININAETQGLSLTGRQVTAVRPPIDVTSMHMDRDHGTSEYAFLLEEVFDQDGIYEDVIAVDYTDIHEDNLEHKKQITPRRRRIGYPPVTPNACVKDSVTSSVFDCMWNEVISWMRDVLMQYSNIVADSNKEVVPSINYLSPQNGNNPTPSSRETSFILHSHKYFYPLQRAHTHLGGSTDTFQDCLRVNSIALQERHGGQDSIDSQVIATARPGSSIPNPKQRPMSVRDKFHMKTRLLGKLAPLAHDRSKTPSVDDDRNLRISNDALQVKGITPNGLSSPPTSFQRNGALPPLDKMERPQRKFISNPRASSAVDNKEGRGLHFNREKSNVSTDLGRPSTTHTMHTMRSETPFVAGITGRRSSTPLGYTTTLKNVHLQGSKNLNVTGNRVPSSDISHLNHMPPDILEDHEGPIDDVIHNQWTPTPSSSNNRYRRGRTLSSLVRTQ